MQVLAKQFGITSMTVGIIFTLVPLCVWISKPTFGFITDKFRDIRSILIVLLMVTALTFFAVLYIPPIRNKIIESTNVTTACMEQRDVLAIHLSKYDSFCDKDITKRAYDCELTSHNCLKNITLNGNLNVIDSLPNNNTSTTSFSFKLLTNNISIENCDCLEQNPSTLACEPDFYACNSFRGKIISEYNLYNFWIFLVLTVISGVGSGTMWSLTDTACNEILGDNSKDYGKQRLWGTISWGVATLASGFFNDIASGGSKYIDFSPGFYLMLTFFAIDIFILCVYPIKKAHVSENICKDVGKIFCTWKTVTFTFGVYMSGAFSGLLWTYEFWFLTDLGSSQLLLGLVAGVQCLVAEVPIFFFSGWFVKKIGHFYCLIAALIAFALRMGLYSILHNPWWVLSIDLLHGVTFAVFFAAMTLYAIDYAPPGTEATMIGIFGGIFEGFGKIFKCSHYFSFEVFSVKYNQQCIQKIIFIISLTSLLYCST